MDFYKLSEKGDRLYKDTYATLTGRTRKNGYAATSLNNAYRGMFVRDSSLQVQAHIANGDMDYAERILKYIIGYHVNTDQPHAIHIMPEVRKSEIYEGGKNIPTSIQKIKANPALDGSHFLVSGPGLYRICSPTNEAYQEFACPFNSISSVTLSTSINCNEGAFVLEIKESVMGETLGRSVIPANCKKTSTLTFNFDTPVKIQKGKTYCFALKTEGGASFVVRGEIHTDIHPSYTLDTAVSGEIRKLSNTLYYLIKPCCELEDDKDIAECYREPVFECNQNSSVVVNGEHTVTLGARDKILLTAEIFAKSETQQGQFSLVLKKGDKEIGEVFFDNSEIFGKPTLVTAEFCFPLFKISDEGEYTLTLKSKDDIIWYSPETSWGYASDVTPYSTMIQVDGNYMLVNAYCHYLLENFNEEFAVETYEYMKKIALRYVTDEEFVLENGLIRDYHYEHSREGRYWNCQCLITNVFASEAFHKFAKVARIMGNTDDAVVFDSYALQVKEAVDKVLICDFRGKKIYGELIGIDKNDWFCKGFSFVSLAPVAADWFGADKDVTNNTCEEYFKTGEGEICGHKVTLCTTTFDENDVQTELSNHAIGKGIGWELYHRFTRDDKEGIDKIMAFMDECSGDTYPEVWRLDGSLSDSANQEQASVIVYEVARITGKYKYNI